MLALMRDNVTVLPCCRPYHSYYNTVELGSNQAPPLYRVHGDQLWYRGSTLQDTTKAGLMCQKVLRVLEMQ